MIFASKLAAFVVCPNCGEIAVKDGPTPGTIILDASSHGVRMVLILSQQHAESLGEVLSRKRVAPTNLKDLN